MNKLTDRPPMSRTDKLCLVALVGCFLAPHLAVWAMDAAAYRAAEADKPQVEMVEIVQPIDCTPLAEAIAARKEELYWQDVPLDQECRKALQEACEASGVPICLALGVIETESNFQADAVSSEGCYGLMQLNARWFPAGLSPEENIRAGVAHLGSLLDEYDGDTAAALTAYHAGSDTSSRTYARRVLDASEKWGCG